MMCHLVESPLQYQLFSNHFPHGPPTVFHLRGGMLFSNGEVVKLLSLLFFLSLWMCSSVCESSTMRSTASEGSVGGSFDFELWDVDIGGDDRRRLLFLGLLPLPLAIDEGPSRDGVWEWDWYFLVQVHFMMTTAGWAGITLWTEPWSVTRSPVSSSS